MKESDAAASASRQQSAEKYFHISNENEEHTSAAQQYTPFKNENVPQPLR